MRKEKVVYTAILEQIAAEMREFGRDLQPPCDEVSLESFKLACAKELGGILPDGYQVFLKATNGFFWDGLHIYATDRAPMVGVQDGYVSGFIEENLGYRDFDPLRDYLIFGDDGTVYFTYLISARCFEVILRVGMTVLETFDTFDELMVNAFSPHLSP